MNPTKNIQYKLIEELEDTKGMLSLCRYEFKQNTPINLATD